MQLIRALLLAGASVVLASPAGAQILIPGAQVGHVRPPPKHRPAEPLFISPSGEPFRGGDGLATWFARADADHDGTITLAEFQADAMRFFKVLDANHDGVIDGFETEAYEQTIAPEISRLDFGLAPGGGERHGRIRLPRRGGPVGQIPGGRPADQDEGGPDGDKAEVRRAEGVGREGAARWSLINEPEPVTQADANVDSRITEAEWRAATLRRFQVLDKARTGRLTLEELRERLPARKGGKRRK